VPVPNLAGKPVPASSRKFLDFAPPWTKWPDYDRVLFVNSIIRTLWPYYNAAIGKIAVDATVPIFRDVCSKVPAGLLQSIDIERLSLGRHPLAIGGIKAYHTKDDSCVFEAPLQWGSALRVRVGVRLKFGPFVVHVPLEVGDVQVRAVARISLRPLVEELPCLGGAEVSLLELPHYDLSLRLVNRVDVMRLPGVKPLVDAVVARVVGDMLLYPNKFAVDLMPGGGVPPPPLGMVEVRIERVEKITDGGSLLSKVDPYVEVQCRKGRVTRTRTVYNCNTPVFDETIAAIVDDPDSQSLNVSLFDDCGGYNDKLIGELSIPLLTSEFFANPGTDVALVLPFSKPLAEGEEGGRDPAAGQFEYDAADGGGAVSGAGAAPPPSRSPAASGTKNRVRLKDKVRRMRGKAPRPEVGLVHMTARYLPFKVDPSQLARLQRAKDAAAAARKAASDAAVEGARRELGEASEAIGGVVAESKRDRADLADANKALDRALSTARKAGVDVSGIKEAGEAPRPSDAGPVSMADVKEEVAEAVEAAEDAADAAGALAVAKAEAKRVAEVQALAAKKKAEEVIPATITEGAFYFLSFEVLFFRRERERERERGGGRSKIEKNLTPLSRIFSPHHQIPRHPNLNSPGPITEDLKGILTLTLVQARNLTADGQVDPFVELSLFDPATAEVKKQWSATWNNEPNPKWGEKFDFVNISATSLLTVTVWDKKGMLESVRCLFFFPQGREGDRETEREREGE